MSAKPEDMSEACISCGEQLEIGQIGECDSCQVNRRKERHHLMLETMMKEGLTIGDCIRAFAIDNENPYVKAARLMIESPDEEIDDATVIASDAEEGGAFVLTWRWVSDENAGILAPSQLFEVVLTHARFSLVSQRDFANGEELDENYLDWLEYLVLDCSDDLDDIEAAPLTGLPGSVNWTNEDGKNFNFMPSTALFRLISLARLGNLDVDKDKQAQDYCVRYGNKLDAILSEKSN